MNDFFSKKRIYVILSLLITFALTIYIRYAVLAFKPHENKIAQRSSVERGSIVDRNGKPLAVQTNFYHFGITPSIIENIEQFAEQFAELIYETLEMEKDEIVENIKKNKDANYLRIKKKISHDQYLELERIISKSKIPRNIYKFDKIPGRIYPEKNLASQVIGYMGLDGIGLSGIEYSQDSILHPKNQFSKTGKTYGDNIYLTIDANLQFKLEKIAQDALKSTQAESLMLIAAQANTGEILSYISLPSTNLNEYPSADSHSKIDRPSVSAYEPGSVFKIFSTAAFLDSNSINANDSFLCDGKYIRTTNLGERIKITCLDHHGWTNIRTALKYSCNDALAQMSEKIDTEEFLDYIKKLGFGEKTGIELPSETRGSVKNTSDKYWSARSKATMSIGQEMSVSALQMVQAASILANYGLKTKLTLISKISDKDGNIKYSHTPEYKERVLKESTAKYILSCMETTAQSGTGSKASLGDISIGVKTGTAQMADPIKGGYSTTDFISNCIAIFPVENPEIILYIVIEKAKGETYAGRIVAPVIAKAANEIIDHLGMYREGAASLEHSGIVTIKDHSPLLVEKTVPNFIGRPKRDLLPLLNSNNVSYSINGEGWVIKQNPPAGTPITEETIIELYLE